MKSKIEKLIKGKSFEELEEIYEGFIAMEDCFIIENMIIDEMEKADLEKFLRWAA